MVNFLKKRLQVFVSSTYIDLLEERQAAVEAILNAGHIPAGMELFSAGDEVQMEVIKQWIDESDVYLLILGGRYGSIEPKSGKSYIHLEYDYALNKNIPLFSCVLEDPDERAKHLGDISKYIERENPQKYKEFSNIVKSKMVKFWSDKKDIKLAIMQTLQDFTRRDDLIGWVRGNEQINLAPVTEEIARLSQENAELRKELAESKTGQFSGLSFEEMKQFLIQTPVHNSIIPKIKKLLDFFWYIRRDLVQLKSRRFIDMKLFNNPLINQNRPEDYLKELVFRGLIQISVDRDSSPASTNIYELSSTGKEFLNKLELERIRNDLESCL